MNSRDSTPLQHPQHPNYHEIMAKARTPSNQQQVLLNGPGTMAIPQTGDLTPPPPQPHQKELNSDSSNRNIIFQQQNVKNSKTDGSVVVFVGATVGSASTTIRATVEPPMRKRGRPRKSVVRTLFIGAVELGCGSINRILHVELNSEIRIRKRNVASFVNAMIHVEFESEESYLKELLHSIAHVENHN
ncbi:hypothetical protein FXO37_24579 [Capsicum annuum]|nr:hypothetical protein FXO37_24579 [Capsicum annuum]